jgi:hypothetical protein
LIVIEFCCDFLDFKRTAITGYPPVCLLVLPI